MGDNKTVLLAKKWDESIDPTGWWMSEKLDGVRAIWNGVHFVSRRGNILEAPDWFSNEMPANLTLDGELFCGRGKFQDVVSIVRRKIPDQRWEKVKYMVFDAPEVNRCFEDRFEVARRICSKSKLKQMKIVEQVRCRNRDHLIKTLSTMLERGAEGLMLREPGSFYEKKRSKTLRKMKDVIDREAKVLRVLEGEGRLKGKMGSLKCRFLDDPLKVKFKVGTGFTDSQRLLKDWEKGMIITVRYQELTRESRPRFPAFVAVRDYE